MSSLLLTKKAKRQLALIKHFMTSSTDELVKLSSQAIRLFSFYFVRRSQRNGSRIPRRNSDLPC